jgi:hypothetical protein
VRERVDNGLPTPRDTIRLIESPESSLEKPSFALFAQPDGL